MDAGCVKVKDLLHRQAKALSPGVQMVQVTFMFAIFTDQSHAGGAKQMCISSAPAEEITCKTQPMNASSVPDTCLGEQSCILGIPGSQKTQGLYQFND